MDFGKYIHELLLENDIVIIPGFGAFVSEYKPAEINDDSDEIKPPSKIVTFNQQIRNNDGLLVGLVAEKKRISHFDALKRIEKERENILYKLDSGEQVEIEEVGILFYTEENTIAFKAEEDENLLLDSFGLEATTIVVEEEIIEEEPLIVPPVIVEETIDETSIPEEVTEKDKTPEEEEQAVETIEEAAPIPVPEPEPVLQKVEEKPEEEKKKRGWVWLFLILIPLIIVSVFIFMKGQKDGASDKTKESATEITKERPAIISQDTTKTDSVEIIANDTLPAIQKDSVIVEETLPAKQIETNSNIPKYYLVGGSFSVEENAETYLNELKAKGFDAFHVGKKGRFFIVGIGTYDTFGQAEKAKQEFMTNNPGSEVWVYKK